MAFIWMSRKGVIAKRVKAAPDGSIENQRPNAQSGWPRNECSALGQTVSVRLKSRPKSKTTRPITHHDPGLGFRDRKGEDLIPRSAASPTKTVEPALRRSKRKRKTGASPPPTSST
ncbi:unnamed protein product [Microthlaspi erraticum]|uniref:Uncharacterized protein n=1 Tax=Microthlaspi erraticum TaxID=1685480 RepID=A0A6D2JYY0_9BRAS|nr:unnamed protein product [Microthlaspi erraticum]